MVIKGIRTMETFKKTILIMALATYAISVDFLSNSSVTLPSSSGYSNAGRINQTVRFLADQLSQNKDFANISDSKIAITSFVDIENLKETNKIGNLISEHLIHDMQIRGYKVVDYKAMPDIEIGSNGDYAFSRSVKNLRKDISLNYILTGTYAFYADGISLNARIIDVQTSIVVSTAQAFIPKYDLQYIVDSMSPMTSMKTYKPDTTSSISIINSMSPMSSIKTYNPDATSSISEDISGDIVPGVESSRVRIRKATW